MMKQGLIIAIGALALTACGERAQTATGVKSDTSFYEGTGHAPFVAGSWKPGDKVSWEQQLKTRVQNGQNDYAKVN